MSSIGGGREGGGVRGVSTFWDPPPEFYWGTFQDYKYIFGILGSRAVNWHPVSGVRWNG